MRYRHAPPPAPGEEPAFKAPSFSCRQGLALVLAVLLLLALLVTGTQPSQAAAGQRIVSLGPSITEMLYALGLESRVVGVTTYCNYPPQAARKPKVGAALDLNEERVLSLKPDLILTVEGDAQRRDRLARLTGAQVVVLPTQRVEDIWTHMRRIGALTGTQTKAEHVTRRLQQRLAAARPKTQGGQKVFYMVWNQPLMSAGPASYLDDLITLAGGRNVVTARSGGSYPTYSWEALLAANPDVILGPQNMKPALEGLKRQYPHLRAVKTQRVRTLPDDLISRPGPRVVEALEAVTRAMK